jgi:hypothetical protein
VSHSPIPTNNGALSIGFSRAKVTTFSVSTFLYTEWFREWRGIREPTLVWKCERVWKCWAGWSMGLLSLALVNWLPYCIQKNAWEDDCHSVVLWWCLSLSQKEMSRIKNRNAILRQCLCGKPWVRDSTGFGVRKGTPQMSSQSSWKDIFMFLLCYLTSIFKYWTLLKSLLTNTCTVSYLREWLSIVQLL